MEGASTTGGEVVLETDRLLLRPWCTEDAGVQRRLWTERDDRVPPHRRIDDEGRPTVADLEASIRENPARFAELFAVQPRPDLDVIGYCGLLRSERLPADEPEVAFDLLRRAWGQGYATEASEAVLGWAASRGYQRLWATVFDWNTASRRVLAKVGFVETGRTEVDPVYGTTLFTTKLL